MHFIKRFRGTFLARSTQVPEHRVDVGEVSPMDRYAEEEEGLPENASLVPMGKGVVPSDGHGAGLAMHSPFQSCDAPLGATLPMPPECSMRYSVVRYLNKGASGFVILVRDTVEDELKALKFVKRAKCADNAQILREVVNQVRLKHPHVIKLDEILMTSEFIILVLEYAEQGDLFSYLKERKRFSEKRARWYFQQLIFAVDFCHRLGIVNRDIKLENLLLKGKKKEIMKIADFGLSKDASKSALRSSVGTVLYLAPELIAGFGKMSEYDGRKAEMWSCGVVLYTMITGYYPFVRKGEKELGQVKLMNKILSRTVNHEYPEPENVSGDVVDLIRHMLHPDPEKRYGTEDVIAHPWFKTGLSFDVVAYNKKVIQQLENGRESPEMLHEAIGQFLNASHNWDIQDSLLKSDFFKMARTISDDELGMVEKMRMTPVRLSGSSVVRFSDNSGRSTPPSSGSCSPGLHGGH